MKIGTLLSAMQSYKNSSLIYNEELSVDELTVRIKSPSDEYVPIQYIIKKQSEGVKLTFDKSHLICADKHILYNKFYLPIHASALVAGDIIRTRTGILRIDKIESVPEQDFYDVTLPSPHVYVDHIGIIHHNSLLTAVLSKKVEKYGRSIVIVPNKDLITQTEKYYIDLGMDVGVYYGDRKDFFKTHTICTWQSLSRLKDSPIDIGLPEPITFEKFVQGVVAVIVDECHGLKGNILKSILCDTVLNKIPIRWAFTGTIPKEDFDLVNLTISMGEVLHRLTTATLQDKGLISKCDVKILQLIDTMSFNDYPAELTYLVTDPDRIEFISTLITDAAKTGNVLVLVGRKKSGVLLEELIPGSIFLSGASNSTLRKEQYDLVATSDDKVIIATSGIAAVGLDIPRINHLFLIEVGKSFVRTIQSVGRAIRIAKDKNFAQIWDITSTCKFSKNHLTSRKKYYKEQLFPFKIEKIEWQK
jgi:superfamily II DNA or RNA helicase